MEAALTITLYLTVAVGSLWGMVWVVRQLVALVGTTTQALREPTPPERAVSTEPRRREAEAAGKSPTLGDDDRTLLAEVHAGRLAAAEAFHRLVQPVLQALDTGSFDTADIPALLDQLATVALPTVVGVEERAVFETTGRRFLPGPPDVLTRPRDRYGGGRHALLAPWFQAGRYALTSDPAALPPAVRATLEAHARLDRANSTARMGHAPAAYYHEDPADDRTQVVLLELPTSRLLGWIWSDVNHLLFGLSRDALRRGAFHEAWISFSN